MHTPVPPRPELVAAVESLHLDLARWLGSAAPEEVFDRFAAAQHPAFTMVTTAGTVLAREELLAGLRGARNARPGLVIDITEVESVVDEAMIVLRFLETHRVGATAESRRVTAVLDRDLCWRSVHETPLS
ncbi:DUF4440 domain-containing protein [Nocardia neocaledoniensis]|uniref:DUF4440 domain-containing protein n=1 Tax=Nocardia neocaledoniensis TaxID=236511 RepID=UPI002458784A|nr:DUF4440 domain-containing protein [Nocardia neocaledoniensis]